MDYRGHAPLLMVEDGYYWFNPNAGSILIPHDSLHGDKQVLIAELRMAVNRLEEIFKEQGLIESKGD